MLGLELPVLTTQAVTGDEGCSDERRSNKVSGWIALQLHRSVRGRLRFSQLGNQEATCVGLEENARLPGLPASGLAC